MRYIRNQLSLWRILLIIGAAAIAIPIASHVSSTAKTVVKTQQDYLHRQTTADNKVAYGTRSQAKYTKANHSRNSKAAAGAGVARPQDYDEWERRRDYWQRRVDRRADDVDDESLDDEDDSDTKADKNKKDDKDTKADKNKKNNKADKDDADDDASIDHELERRRDYWRRRLDRDW